jgi:hypothetical protein
MAAIMASAMPKARPALRRWAKTKAYWAAASTQIRNARQYLGSRHDPVLCDAGGWFACSATALYASNFLAVMFVLGPLEPLEIHMWAAL